MQGEGKENSELPSLRDTRFDYLLFVSATYDLCVHCLGGLGDACFTTSNHLSFALQ
jgi:hypothetical protein